MLVCSFLIVCYQSEGRRMTKRKFWNCWIPSFVPTPKSAAIARKNSLPGKGKDKTSTTPPTAMRITQLQRPLVAAASNLTRRPTPAAGTTTIRQLQEALGALRIGASNATVEGRRYASVKSQGMYKLRDSSTIPKKLGAKKSGGTFTYSHVSWDNTPTTRNLRHKAAQALL